MLFLTLRDMAGVNVGNVVVLVLSTLLLLTLAILIVSAFVSKISKNGPPSLKK